MHRIAWRGLGRPGEAHDKTTRGGARDAQQRLRRGTSEDHERLNICTIEHNRALLGPYGACWRAISLVLSCLVLSWRALLAGGEGWGNKSVGVIHMAMNVNRASTPNSAI